MKVSKNGRRFYTALDMATVKHQQDVQNARVKRGEYEDGPIHHVSPCGCGVEGCFGVFRTNPSKDVKFIGRYDLPKVGSRHDEEGLSNEWKKPND